MRLRNALLAGASALLVALAVPSSAHAATGEFLYTPPGIGIGTLADPESGQCINLPGATDADPASAPKNFTLSTATVFLDSNCDGDVYYVMNPGKVLGSGVKVRSVIFT